MPRSQLRQRLSRAAAGIERSLPVDRRFYLLVAFGFGFVGYFSGMALLGRWTQQPISLEEPSLPPVEGGANPVLPGAPITPEDLPEFMISDVDEEQTSDLPPPELRPAPVIDRSEFTEAENCRIWRRTFPEAAAKLEPGDACY